MKFIIILEERNYSPYYLVERKPNLTLFHENAYKYNNSISAA